MTHPRVPRWVTCALSCLPSVLSSAEGHAQVPYHEDGSPWRERVEARATAFEGLAQNEPQAQNQPQARKEETPAVSDRGSWMWWRVGESNP